MDELDLFSHFDEEEKEEDGDKKMGEGDKKPNLNNERRMVDEEERDRITGKKRGSSSPNEVEEPLLKKRKFVTCSHEICYPKNFRGPRTYQMDKKPTLKFKKYEFTLDQFQEESISCIEQGESVLVSAHTSAGKTVVAEYAIAQSLQTNSRVVYTSPIKALSNQKYRDLKNIFGDVGLITGDVTISPNANCLIMTTEILRTMLYKGHDLLSSVKWVIFDEVHYLRDEERGVVWEESIILLPNEVKYVFLSATIPNASEFAGWVSELKQQPVHVIYTDQRPIPLKHYAYPMNGKGIFLIKDENNIFRSENFGKLLVTNTKGRRGRQNHRGERQQQFQRRDQEKKDKSEQLFLLLRLIHEKEFYPVIFFSFSRRECEDYGAYVKKKITMTTKEEEKMIDEIFHSAMENLNEEDRSIPQINNVLPLLKKGIGVHHSGLLPIMKELVEILFSEGLIKVLFATETFAMGLNMPARTCVFTSLQKWDGKGRRALTTSEYTQMSGRAGRRGVDTRGLVMVMMGGGGNSFESRRKSDRHVFKRLLFGEIDALKSAFHLTYFTILNLFRVEELDPRYIMDRSFLRYQYERHLIPQLQSDMRILEDEIENNPRCKINHESLVEEYERVYSSWMSFKRELHSKTFDPKFIPKFLSPGRLILVSEGWGWSIVVACRNYGHTVVLDVIVPAKMNFKRKRKRKKQKKKKKKKKKKRRNVFDDMSSSSEEEEFEEGDRRDNKVRGYQPLFRTEKNDAGNNSSITCYPFPKSTSSTKIELIVCPIELNKISAITSLKIHVPQNINSDSARMTLFKKLDMTLKNFKGLPPPLLDPVKDLKITNARTLMGEIQRLDGERIKALRRFKGIIQQRSNGIIDEDDDEEKMDNEEEEEEEEEFTEREIFMTESIMKKELDKYMYKQKLEGRRREIRMEMSTVGQKGLMLTYDRMTELLRRLNFVSSRGDKVLTIKGKFAAEVSNGDCIIITELMLSTQASNLDEVSLGALLSCFVFEQNISGNRKSPLEGMPKKLVENYKMIQNVCGKIERVKQEIGFPLEDIRECRSMFSPVLMEVTYNWLKGFAFFQIAQKTKVYEGEIIRVMRRLEELLRQLICAVKVIGETNLEKKLKGISSKLKRDIAFSSSLYI